MYYIPNQYFFKKSNGVFYKKIYKNNNVDMSNESYKVDVYKKRFSFIFLKE